MAKADKQQRAFEFFNEIGIINQLAVTMFNKRLPDGIHVSHFAVLNHLVRVGDGKTPQSITDAFQVTKGTMTHTLAVLTKRGWITTQPHETDRRSKLVYITEEGRTFCRDAIAAIGPALAKLGAELNFGDMDTALPILREVREILDANRDV